MKTVFLVSGLKSSGKDTTCDILDNILPECPHRVAFADKLKRIVSIIFDVPLEVVEGKTPENRRIREEIIPYWSDYLSGITTRKALTVIGTDVLREYVLDEIWGLSTAKNIIIRSSKYTVVSDLRDPHTEEKLFRDLLPSQGFRVVSIRLVRETPEWWEHAKKAYYDKDKDSIDYLDKHDIHYSEWGQVGITPDHIIYNETNENAIEALKNLEDKIREVVDKYI